MRTAFLLAVCLMTLWGGARACFGAPERLRAVALEVVDGDTLRVSADGRNTPLRLIGIDAPEWRQNEKALRDVARTKADLALLLDCGAASRAHLQTLVGPGKILWLEFDVRRLDRYGRILAYVFLADGTFLNEQMVADGYAGLLTVPPDVKYEGRLRAAFEQARSSGAGLWGREESRKVLMR